MTVADFLIQLTHLQALGVTHIVCIKHPGKDVFIRANFPEHFRYLHCNLANLALYFAWNNWKSVDYLTVTFASNILFRSNACVVCVIW